MKKINLISLSNIFGRRDTLNKAIILLILVLFAISVPGLILYRPLFLCNRICGEIVDARPGYIQWISKRTTRIPKSETQIISCIDREHGLVDLFYLNKDDIVDSIEGREIEAYYIKSTVSCQTDWDKIPKPWPRYKQLRSKGEEYKINYLRWTTLEIKKITVDGNTFIYYNQLVYKIIWSVCLVISLSIVLCLYKYQKLS